MDIYETLKKDHANLTKLLDKLVQASESDKKEWKGLIDEIRDELIPHSRAEEAVFYNAIRELNPKNDVITHSYVEHTMAETDLRTLQAMKAIDVNWTRLAKKLQTDILHHIKQEEGKVFSAGQKLFKDEEAKMIGKAFSTLKPIVKNQSFIGTTADLISNLLPQRLTESFKKNFSKGDKLSA